MESILTELKLMYLEAKIQRLDPDFEEKRKQKVDLTLDILKKLCDSIYTKAIAKEGKCCAMLKFKNYPFDDFESLLGSLDIKCELLYRHSEKGKRYFFLYWGYQKFLDYIPSDDFEYETLEIDFNRDTQIMNIERIEKD